MVERIFKAPTFSSTSFPGSDFHLFSQSCPK
jgi:pyruvate-formate lyase-activating enzyme